MGSQEPSERVAPDYTASDGLDAAKLVRIGGTVLDQECFELGYS